MNKEDRLSRILRSLLIILGIAIFAAAGSLFYYIYQYSSENKLYEDIRRKAHGNTEHDLPGETAGSRGQASDDSTDSGVSTDDPGGGADIRAGGQSGTADFKIDFDTLYKINEDTAGWIYACEGSIDGPVVQAADDDHYLNHLFDGSAGGAGCFFADRLSRPAFHCPVTVIYGHNRKDGSMFHPLLKYKDRAYYADNPAFTVCTPEGNRDYMVFAAFYSDLDDIPGVGSSWRIDQTNDISFVKRIFKEASDRALYETLTENERESFEQSIGKGDAGIVILSTCEYSGENNRMAVFGISE